MEPAQSQGLDFNRLSDFFSKIFGLNKGGAVTGEQEAKKSKEHTQEREQAGAMGPAPPGEPGGLITLPHDLAEKVFDENKNSLVLYDRYENPYELPQIEANPHYSGRSSSIPMKHHRTNAPSPFSSPLPSPICAPSHPTILSPTFSSNAPEFLKKFHEELESEPQEGSVVGDFLLGEILGVGAFSTFREGCFLKDQSQKVAVKIVDKKSAEARVIRNVRKEIELWKQINHFNFVQFYDMVESSRFIFVMCEKCQGGRLLDHVLNQSDGYLAEPDAHKIMVQLLSALQYLRSESIYHGDIKLENILLDETCQIVKICDFGFSKKVKEKEPLGEIPQDESFHRQTCGGTLLYCAPEVLKGQENIGFYSDIWSLGVSLFAMVTGELPFDDDYEPRLKHLIINGKFRFPSEPEISQELQELIRGMLRPCIEERFDLEKISQHPWMLRE